MKQTFPSKYLAYLYLRKAKVTGFMKSQLMSYTKGQFDCEAMKLAVVQFFPVVRESFQGANRIVDCLMYDNKSRQKNQKSDKKNPRSPKKKGGGGRGGIIQDGYMRKDGDDDRERRDRDSNEKRY